MNLHLLIVGAFLTLQADAKLPDGVYTMCAEVAGYSSETIELKNGKFRYWFRSDVNAENEPDYPLAGTYRMSGNTLILENDKSHSPKRTIAVVNGVDVLWRKDGLELWEKDRRVHPYAVLIRAPKETDGSKLDSLPSIKSLYSKEMLAREKKEYEERYNDQPAEIRVLLRAQSLEGDSDLAV